MRPTTPVTSGPPRAARRRGAAAWVVACAACGVAGYALGAAGRDPNAPGRPEIAAAQVVPCDAASLPVRVPPTAGGGGGAPAAERAPDPRPPPDDAAAMLAWKQRQLAAANAPAPSPDVKASDEVAQALERDRGALVSRCWDTLAPDDRESAARLKLVAEVDPSGHVGSWRTFEVPETRRPELVQCVTDLLARSDVDVSPPGRAISVAATIVVP